MSAITFTRPTRRIRDAAAKQAGRHALLLFVAGLPRAALVQAERKRFLDIVALRCARDESGRRIFRRLSELWGLPAPERDELLAEARRLVIREHRASREPS
jgi:hypothetical protein